jgi:predicted dehydrogenase
VGVVGAGFVARAVHLPRLARLRSRFSVVALAEPDEALRERVAAEYSVPAAFADHRRMLADAALDAVLVCAPNEVHAEVVLDALAAGAHVLTEKPLCLSEEDADRIVTARDRSGLVVQVGCMKRFDPAWEALEADLLCSRPGLLHVDVLTHDPWLPAAFAPAGERPAPPPRALDVRSAVFHGALVHDVNLLHGILEAAGERIPATPVDAFARPDGTAAGLTVALGEHARAHLAWILVPGLHDFRERVVVHAADGVRELEFPAPYLGQAPTAYRSGAGSDETHVAVTRTSWRDRYVAQLEHFHACVTEGVPCRVPPEQAGADIALLEAAHRLATTRGAVTA